MTVLPLLADPSPLPIYHRKPATHVSVFAGKRSNSSSLSMASFSVRTLLLQVLLLVTASYCMIEEENGREGQREFDYFALSLQWPGTICQRTRYCCSSNACCRGNNTPTEFTIHGLWPDYNDGTWPECCYRSDFNEKEISTLRDALEKYWPSYYCSSSKTCHGTKGPFWAHEKVLNEAGYVPSNTEKYPLGGIVSAIQNAFHTTPLVVCSKGAVEELRLCFYKDFKPRDCVIGSVAEDGTYNLKSSCPKYISLPAYVSLELDDAKTAGSWVPDTEAL